MNIKRLEKLIIECNLIIEVVDSRDTAGTELKKLGKLVREHKILKVATKTDLADQGIIKKLKEIPGYILINSKTSRPLDEKAKIINAILSRSKVRPMRVLVVGYPNVGKSTLINLLAEGKKARVSPIAGTTKNIQWIRIHPEILLMDSPGTFPKKEDKLELLRKGAINIDGIRNFEAYALDIAKICIKDERLRKWLELHFDIKLEEKEKPIYIIEKIAKRRNWLNKGGELNTSEASKTLVREYKKAPVI